MSKAILDAARELITAKKYDEARQILKTIPADATAQRWLAKLDEIAPLRTSTPEPPRSAVIAKPSSQAIKRSKLPLIAGFAGLLILVVLVGIVALTTPKPPVEELAALPTLMPSQSSVAIPTNRTDFINFIRSEYSSIGDQPLKIDEVSLVDDEESKVLAVWLHEASAPTFSQQARRLIQDYTEALYAAAQAYFGEADFTVHVLYNTHVPQNGATLENLEGVQVHEYTDGLGWRLNVTLSQGAYFDGIKVIEILLPDIALAQANLPRPTADPVSSEEAFKEYVRNNFGTIGGRLLGIRDVSVINAGNDRGVTIVLDSQRDSELFLSQTQETLASYTGRLYDQAVEYFGGTGSGVFGVAVTENMYVDEVTPEISVMNTVYVGEKEPSGQTQLTVYLAMMVNASGTREFAAIPFVDYDGIRNPRSAMIAPTNTTVTLSPTSSSTPIPPLAANTTSPASGMTRAQFEQNIIDNYATIAGLALDIDDVSILSESSAQIVSINLTDVSGRNVFREQTKADAEAYIRRLLGDARAYFATGDVAVYVSFNDYTDSLQDYHYDDEWWYIGDYDVDDGWYVSMTLAKAYLFDGRESVEVWNYR